MVPECRDILVMQHRGHPHVAVGDGRHANFLRLSMRLELLAQSREGLGEVAVLLLGPSLVPNEESMLDGVARDAPLPFGVRGPVESAALRRLAARRRGVSASGGRRE